MVLLRQASAEGLAGESVWQIRKFLSMVARRVSEDFHGFLANGRVDSVIRR